MKYWLLKIDCNNGILYDSIANKEIAYSCVGANSISAGDYVLGYICTPIDETRMIFKATKDGENNIAFLEKFIDINKGIELEKTSEDKCASLYLSQNSIVELTNKEFLDISSALYDYILSQKDFVISDNDKHELSVNVFDGFSAWLTTYNNPDYTGKEKYASYPNALKKIVKYMFDENLIDDLNLNELNVEKYQNFMDIYNSSVDVQLFDKEHCSNCAGKAALVKYILYIRYLLNPSYDYKLVDGQGENLVVYGTPGCGKSYYVDHDVLGKDDNGEYSGEYKEENIIRTTFFQDYSNTDFVGQVMPIITTEINNAGKEEQIVTYRFVPGPFTLALECAIAHPTEKVALVIEELNRGNAPSIFGDLFQLLDRINDEGKGYPVGTSEYGITNVNIINYLSDNTHYEKKWQYAFNLNEIRLPANLYLYATMNTSDQNVFTLDTAFKRRWAFEKLKNEFTDKHTYADYRIPGMPGIKWKKLVNDINDYIVSDADAIASEDKQIGVYFVAKNMLCSSESECNDEQKKLKFAYKLFEYLWDDVAKFSRSNWFGDVKTLDNLIEKYLSDGIRVFKDGVIKNDNQ